MKTHLGLMALSLFVGLSAHAEPITQLSCTSNVPQQSVTAQLNDKGQAIVFLQKPGASLELHGTYAYSNVPSRVPVTGLSIQADSVVGSPIHASITLKSYYFDDDSYTGGIALSSANQAPYAQSQLVCKPTVINGGNNVPPMPTPPHHCGRCAF